MGFLSRFRGGAPASSGPRVDPHQPDGAWFRESERVYESSVGRHYGSPETIAEGGLAAAARGDDGVALHFFAKSIDLLHTLYGYGQMQSRRPSDRDLPVLVAHAEALARTLEAHPEAPIDELVRETTHRLRSIATTCDGAGIGSRAYRDALDRLAAVAPHVRTEDVLWT